jgi:putative phosphoesterase
LRIAILADIHGNLAALEAVLADLNAHQPQLVVVNGDLVNRGPQSRAVVERLGNSKLSFTLGNHDHLVVQWAAQDPAIAQLFSDPLFSNLNWVVGEMGAEQLKWLAALPYQLYLEDLDIRIAHGSPRHYREGYDDRLSETAFAEIVRDYPARVLVGSHTHNPYVREGGGVLMLNTGAVGASFTGDPRAHYLLLDIEGEKVGYELRKLAYNYQATKRAFHTSGFLEAGGMAAQIFYQELHSARSILTSFWFWTEQNSRPRDFESLWAFKQVFPERFEPAEVFRV